MKIYINQPTAVRELNISSSTINKIYNLVYKDSLIDDYLTADSNMIGNINTNYTYSQYVNKINERFPNLDITAKDYYILFKDSAVLQVLLNSGIGDSIGILESVAQSTNSIPKFENNTDIVSFDELKYFVNVKSIPGWGFNNCSNLKSIDLSYINTLNTQAFCNCTSLETVKGTSNITSISNGVFQNCSSLQGEIDLSAVSITPDASIFNGCSNIERIILGDLNFIGKRWHEFDAKRLFFGNCYNLHTVDIKSLTEITGGSIGGAFLNTHNMQNFVLRCAIVPTLASDSSALQRSSFGSNNVNIYVPDEAIDDYKTQWSTVADYIYPLSEYTPIEINNE